MVTRRSIRKIASMLAVVALLIVGPATASAAIPTYRRHNDTGSENGHVHKHDVREVAAKSGGASGTIVALLASGVVVVGAGMVVMLRRQRRPSAV